MAKKKTDSVNVVVYILLIVVNLFVQMLLSGESVSALLSQIFTQWTGIFQTLADITVWIISNLFGIGGVALVALMIGNEFVFLPLMVRYKYLTVKPNLMINFVIAIYAIMIFRLLLEIGDALF